MHLTILAVAGKPSPWLATAEQNFLKRLPRAWRAQVALLPASKKSGGAHQRQEDEWSRLDRRVGADAKRILLDERGTSLTSRALADRMAAHIGAGHNLAIVLGGPDGFSDSAREAADELWSLSPLTLPHELARLVLVEQLYRAQTIIEGHPYHRD